MSDTGTPHDEAPPAPPDIGEPDRRPAHAYTDGGQSLAGAAQTGGTPAGGRAGARPRRGDLRPPRPHRRRRADRLVWAALVLVAVVIVVVAFAAPLPDAASSAPVAGPEATATTIKLDPRVDADDSVPTPGSPSTPVPSGRSVSGTSSPTSRRPVSIACGGDVMGAWGVDAAIRSRGADYVMSEIKRVLKPADVAFLNAESPFSTAGSPQTWKDVYFRGNPALVPAMARAGVDVVTMANNHCLDYKAPALLDSIRRFNKVGVKVVGAGRNATEAWRFRYVTRNGVRIGFMGWTDVMPPGFAATSSSAGAAVGPLWSGAARIHKAIRAASKKADIVVVAFHWGVEGTHYPITQQIQEAHAAIDAGADLVMSHHPHWLQGIERYHGGMIMYSFGDLVFPPLSRAAAETVIMTSTVSERWITATITPYLLDGNGVPHRATGGAARSILTQLDRFSRARGTRLTFDWAHQRATVKVKRRDR